MDYYQLLSQRLLKYSRFNFKVCIVSFIVFIILNAANTGQQILNIITVIAFFLFVATALEAAVLFAIGKIMSLHR